MANDVAKTTETTEEFRTTNHVLDEATFYEVKKYLYPVFKQKVILIITIIAMIVGVICFAGFSKYIIGILLVVFGLLFFMDALVARGRAVRKSIKQIRQITGKDFCTYIYTFTDKDLFVRCMETNMNEHIPYENLVRRTETKNAIVLFTKESRMIIFRKNALNEKEMKKLIQTVDERCPEMVFVPHSK